jgi:hypothetical protein
LGTWFVLLSLLDAVVGVYSLRVFAVTAVLSLGVLVTAAVLDAPARRRIR